MGGRLIVISGPSGVGKGTVVAELMKQDPDLVLSISVTTRKPRPGEKDGVDYYFIDFSQFKQMVVTDALLEWAYVHGSYYGTPKEFVLRHLSEGKKVILEIDMQGAMQVKRRFPDAMLIFLLPPSLEELKRRLISRGTEQMDEQQLRLLRSLQELDYLREYQFFVVNMEISQAVENIRRILSLSDFVVTEDRARDIIDSLRKGGVLNEAGDIRRVGADYWTP
ncbi:guanylate kinase [Coprothermobacteraceae bacterium]|nr:guanylate kinase [Coprothermobacteraceae bacterium]